MLAAPNSWNWLFAVPVESDYPGSSVFPEVGKDVVIAPQTIHDDQQLAPFQGVAAGQLFDVHRFPFSRKPRSDPRFPLLETGDLEGNAHTHVSGGETLFELRDRSRDKGSVVDTVNRYKMGNRLSVTGAGRSKICGCLSPEYVDQAFFPFLAFLERWIRGCFSCWCWLLVWADFSFVEYESQHPFNVGHCLRAFGRSGLFWRRSRRIAHFPPRSELRSRLFFFRCHTLSFRGRRYCFRCG